MKFVQLINTRVILDQKEPIEINDESKLPVPEWKLIIHYYKNSDELFVRLNLNVNSIDKKFHLEKYFGSLYKIDCKLYLQENIESESLKIASIFIHLIKSINSELTELEGKFHIPDLVHYPIETIANNFLDNFNYLKDVSH